MFPLSAIITPILLSAAAKANGFDIEALMRQSDSALYTAKNSGKNCVCLYGEELDGWDDLCDPDDPDDLDDEFRKQQI